MTTFHYTVSVITAWLQSCETEEQLELFPSIIQRFILDRFKGKIEDWELNLVRVNLEKEVEKMQSVLPDNERRAYKAANGYESAVIGTFITPQGNLLTCLKSSVA